MQRAAFFAYGLACYVMFVGVFAYSAGFLGNFLVPRSIDVGPEADPVAALLINLALLLLFGVQHSLMARPTFKRWWTRIVPEPIERSTYVLFSNLALIVLFWQWRPIDTPVWEIESPIGQAAMWALFAIGWLLVFASTLLLNHFDLFGLRQVWLHLRGRPYTHTAFRVPLLYRYVRHPLYVGWILAFLAAPRMSAGHLLFVGVCVLYILVAIRLEERNLVDAHGAAYESYREQVPMLVPIPGRNYRAPTDEAAPACPIRRLRAWAQRLAATGSAAR